MPTPSRLDTDCLSAISTPDKTVSSYFHPDKGVSTVWALDSWNRWHFMTPNLSTIASRCKASYTRLPIFNADHRDS